MSKIVVGALLGSLRQDSVNRKLLNAAIKLAPEGVEIVPIDITQLPMFNQDDESQLPKAAKQYKDMLQTVDALLIVTPEHNRSIPAVLKNALDWASRPWGHNSVNGKTVAIMGATGGNVGTFGAQQHLRSILGFLNTYTLGQPEFYLADAYAKFDASGELIDDSTAEHITGLLEALLAATKKMTA